MDQARIKIHSAVTGYRHPGQPTLVAAYNGIEFRAREFIAVVGKNGVGKSTLLRSICGLQPLLAGDILIDSKSLTSYSSSDIAKKVAIVLTEKIGGFNLKVQDVVANGQVPYTDAFHRLRGEHWKVVEEAMNRCGVMDYRMKAVDELSDGMLQKTMIARAVAQQTNILLLDEPTAYLDYASRHDLFVFLRQEADNGKCVLISTHELDLALRHCTSLLVVHDGKGILMNASGAAGNEILRQIAGGYLGY